MRVVLFDLDGVLVDSRRPIAGAIRFALEQRGLRPVPDAVLHRFIGAPLRNVFRDLLEAQRADASGVEDCIDAYRVHYARVATTETVAVAGVKPVLERLLTGGPLGIVTSKPVEFAIPILESVGLLPCFDHVTGPELDAHEAKRDTLARALTIGGSSRSALLVGDTRFDVEAAHAHRIPVLGVTWGIGSAEELERAGADALADRPEDIVGWVEQAGSRS